MKKFILLLFCLSHLFAYGQTKKVLFLGNSYTFYNDLPLLVRNLAVTGGNSMVYDSYAPGGYTLLQHFNDPTALNKIKAGGWDYVVLQDQSQLPSFPEYNDAPGYNLCSLIRKHNPCARVLFYMTWGRKNGDASNCPVWPPVCTYEGMDSLLRLRYTEMATLSEAGVSPVGVVWRDIRTNNPGIELYDTDGSHPSLAGSYVAACSFYASIFKKDPALASYVPPGLNTTYAAAIKQAAKQQVFNKLPQWDFGKYIPAAKFTYTIGSGANEIIFTNASTGADSLLWDFGDGNFSKAENPVHQYAADGSYTVTLTASNCDLGVTHVSTQQATVRFCAHTPTVFPENLVICPNSKDTLWTQAYDAYQWLDESGDTIPGETKQYILPKGGNSYSVLARKNNCVEESRRVQVGLYVNLAFFNVNTDGPFIGADSLCMGDTLMVMVMPNKPPYPQDKNIQWFKEGIPLPLAGNDTLLVTQSGAYKVKIIDSFCTPPHVVYESPETFYTFVNCGGSTGIAENTKHSIRLYPNPAAQVLQVHIPLAAAGNEYTISDVFGKTILAGRLEQETNDVDLSGFSSGVYILKTGTQALKFIKE